MEGGAGLCQSRSLLSLRKMRPSAPILQASRPRRGIGLDPWFGAESNGASQYHDPRCPRTMGSCGVPFAPERSPLALHFRLRSSELRKAGARPELRMTSGSETEVRLLPSPWLRSLPARPRPRPAGDVGPDPWGELGSAPCSPGSSTFRSPGRLSGASGGKGVAVRASLRPVFRKM